MCVYTLNIAKMINFPKLIIQKTEGWGDKGYIKLSIKSDTPDKGHCGIYELGSYATIRRRRDDEVLSN